jgi:hypothetical protein
MLLSASARKADGNKELVSLRGTCRCQKIAGFSTKHVQMSTNSWILYEERADVNK